MERNGKYRNILTYTKVNIVINLKKKKEQCSDLRKIISTKFFRCIWHQRRSVRNMLRSSW